MLANMNVLILELLNKSFKCIGNIVSFSPNAHYRVHKILLLNHIIFHTNQVQILSLYFFKSDHNTILLDLRTSFSLLIPGLKFHNLNLKFVLMWYIFNEITCKKLLPNYTDKYTANKIRSAEHSLATVSAYNLPTEFSTRRRNLNNKC